MGFFFRYPITIKKYIMAARMQAVAKAYEAIFVIVGINTIWLFQFVICPVNDNNILSLIFLFRQIPKIFMFSFYYDRWSNKLVSTVCISFSWHICLKDIGWSSVCFVN